MKNNYGNFVVQKALKLSTGHNKLKLISCIVKNIEKIGDRKIILKWKSIVEGHICPENEILIKNLMGINNTNNTNFLNNLPQMLNYSAPMHFPVNNMYPTQNFQTPNNFNNSNVNINFNNLTPNTYPEVDYNVNTLSNGLPSNVCYNNHQGKLSLENNHCMSRMNNYSFGAPNPYLPGSPNYFPSSPNNSFNFVNNQPNNYHTQFVMEKPCTIYNNENMHRKSAPSEMSINNVKMDFYPTLSLFNKKNNNYN
jgi:hypothetical protein